MVDDIAITKQMLIDAICGAGFQSIEMAKAIEAAGHAIFVGTEDNPRWVWNRDKLRDYGIDELAGLYMEITNAS